MQNWIKSYLSSSSVNNYHDVEVHIPVYLSYQKSDVFQKFDFTIGLLKWTFELLGIYFKNHLTFRPEHCSFIPKESLFISSVLQYFYLFFLKRHKWKYCKTDEINKLYFEIKEKNTCPL